MLQEFEQQNADTTARNLDLDEKVATHNVKLACTHTKLEGQEQALQNTDHKFVVAARKAKGKADQIEKVCRGIDMTNEDITVNRKGSRLRLQHW